MSNPLARVGLIINSQLRYLTVDIAKLLHEHHGSEVHVFCKSDLEVEFCRQQDPEGRFASVINYMTARYELANSRPEPKATIARAKAYEARIGCTYNTLAVANRVFGHGYALGGYYHPRSRFAVETDYIQFLHYYNQLLDALEREFVEKRLTLVINGVKEVACIARMLDIPFRTLAGPRYKNYHYWAVNEFFETPLLEPAFHATDAADAVDITSTYVRQKAFRREYERNLNIVPLARNLGMTLAWHTYGRLRGFDLTKKYYLREKLLHLVRNWREAHRVKGMHLKKLDDLGDIPFIFYPLNTEPEIALGQLSPEYFFQLRAIAALSRDLPAGFWLVVKEHTDGVGRRPRHFYEQIRDLKNVIMLDMEEHGFEVVKRARGVATITSTAGFEAAVMGKPVISFGRHNLYGFLPHVFTVKDEGALRDILKRILVDGVDLEEAARDGARFLQAAIDTSFDLGIFNYLHVDQYETEAVEVAYRGLLGSVGLGASVVMSAGADSNAVATG